MSSPKMESPRGNSPALASKSKQERIRDNQRRSRARRQEYLADLERKLRESHALCREAELRRSACLELERENARLRTLLNVCGVPSDLVESFLHQNPESVEEGQGSGSGQLLRRLKPKLPPLEGKSTTGPSIGGETKDSHRKQPVDYRFKPIMTGTGLDVAGSLPPTTTVLQFLASTPAYSADYTPSPSEATMMHTDEESNWLSELPQMSPSASDEDSSCTWQGKPLDQHKSVVQELDFLEL